VAVAFSEGIQSTGVCLPDREPQCDLSGANFAPDLRGTTAQLWALAKVVLAPDTDTWIVYVDLHGAHAVTASVDGSTHVGIDTALNLVAVTYPKNPAPGTVLTLVVTADDGAESAFGFAVS
jgi:hypothetical protein